MLQKVLEKYQRWWLQIALGCYSIPSSQIICRNPQWCEYFVNNRWTTVYFGYLSNRINVCLQQKYKAQFEKTKGKMIGLKGLKDDINIAHSVHATDIQSDVSIPEDWARLQHLEYHKYEFEMSCTSDWSAFYFLSSNTKRTLLRCTLSSIYQWICWMCSMLRRLSL